MTAQEIREWWEKAVQPNPSGFGPFETKEGKMQCTMLKEIALQLAEFNERCAQNCTPNKKESIPFAQREIAER